MVEVAELRLTLVSLLTTMVLTGGSCGAAAVGSLEATTLEFPPLSPPPFWLTMTTVVAVALALAVAEVFSEQEELISVTSMANDTCAEKKSKCNMYYRK